MPLLPLDIEIVDFEENTSYPTITINDFDTDSIGYPIRVPIILSDKPANLIKLTITSSFVKEESEEEEEDEETEYEETESDILNEILSITPTIIEIDGLSTNLEFFLTITTDTVP